MNNFSERINKLFSDSGESKSEFKLSAKKVVDGEVTKNIDKVIKAKEVLDGLKSSTGIEWDPTHNPSLTNVKQYVMLNIFNISIDEIDEAAKKSPDYDKNEQKAYEYGSNLVLKDHGIVMNIERIKDRNGNPIKH